MYFTNEIIIAKSKDKLEVRTTSKPLFTIHRTEKDDDWYIYP